MHAGLGATIAGAAASSALAVGTTVALPRPASPLTALRASHLTYYAYTDPRWWGTQVDVGIARLRVSKREPRLAGAILTVRDRSGVARGKPQWVLLRRSGAWRVVRTQAEGAFDCAFAPAGVIRELFGRCAANALPVTPITSISGTVADRAPTASERAGIIAAYRKTGDRCARFHIRVSRLDGDYALTWSIRTGKAGCPFANGVTLTRRTGTGWILEATASDPFPCTAAPPGVVRSLTAGCWVYGRPG